MATAVPDVSVNGPEVVASGGELATPRAAATSPGTKKIKELLARLEEPFPAEVISWKPQVTSWRDPENPVAKAAAYADQRAYSDRLNELFGPQGWTREYAVHVANNLDRVLPAKGKDKPERVLNGQGKVMVVARVTIHALGTHTGTGESWLDDDNAFTIAEAQAFKRACVCFGLGRYLYNLPETEWLPIDRFTKQLKVTPPLPDWALPGHKGCIACGSEIKDRTVNRVPYTAQQLAKRGQELYGLDLCADCQIERARVSQQGVQKKAG